jgi:hypothetical protein
MNISRGMSSLLFIVPTILSASLLGFHCYWTISNGFLLITSFLYNSTQSDVFLFLDHVGIFCVGVSYVSDPRIAGIMVVLAVYEFYRSRRVGFMKNALFAGSLLKCNRDSLHINPYLFTVLFVNTVGALVVYRVRHQVYLAPYYQYSRNLIRQHLRLTWIWHLCIMNILTHATVVILSNQTLHKN